MKDINYLIATKIMHWKMGYVEPNDPESPTCWFDQDDNCVDYCDNWIPDEDIYDTFEAEEMFPKELAEEYVMRVIEILKGDNGDVSAYDLLHASPIVRCEAMLDVLAGYLEDGDITLPEVDGNASSDENQ